MDVTLHLKGLGKAALLGAGGGIGNQQNGTNNASADGVHAGSGKALYEDFVGRFLIDQDIEAGGNQQPGDGIADDLNDVECDNVIQAEGAFFNLGALESETKYEAGNTAGNDPAPPRAAILDGIAEAVADEADQSAGDRPKQGSEESAQAVSGLEAGFRNGGWDLDVHKEQGEDSSADAGGNNGAGVDLEKIVHGLISFVFWKARII